MNKDDCNHNLILSTEAVGLINRKGKRKMTASQSNLALYGYDLVLAITQGSINVAMKEYLSALEEPEVAICYVADKNGNPTCIEYSELKKKANGSDPFSVPDGVDPNTNQDLKNLFGARFMVGFKAQIGLPPGLHPQDIPDVVTLGSDTSRVPFTLMCSEFIVVQLTPGNGYAPGSWLNKSQPSGKPWLFTTSVDLRLGPADKSAYDKLPPDVQKQIKDLGENAFSVQQLIFVLSNAGLQPIPTISGVDPASTLYLVLEKYFINEYFLTLQKNGQPVLGAAVLPKNYPASVIVPTNLNYEILPLLDTNGQPVKNPTKDQQKLATLNYLLATDGHELPDPPKPFTWNWLDKLSEESEYHGVFVMKSDIFWNHLLNDLKKHISQFCLKPFAKVWWSDTDNFYRENGGFEVDPKPNLPENSKPGAPYYFKYDQEAADYDTHDGVAVYLTIHTTYEFTLTFDRAAKTFSIKQHLTVYVYEGYNRVIGGEFDNNIIDKTIETTYGLNVDEHGMIVTRILTNKTDDGTAVTPDPKYNIASYIVNNLLQKLNPMIYNYQPPTTALQNFIFPGGNTFAFKNAAFSDYMDLIAHITYSDPR